MGLLIFYAMLALFVSFICSLLEASLLSLPPSHVEYMAELDRPGGKTLKRLKENIDRPLAAILTLNTVAHTVGAAGVGAQAAIVFGDTAVGIASAVMTFAILVLSEIIPKTLGAVHAKALAATTAWITSGMIIICMPVIWLLERVNRMIGYQRSKAGLGRMEVLATIKLGGQSGVLAERERRIATNVMALSNIKIADILTPRTVVFALNEDIPAERALREHNPIRFARIPVYSQSIDHVTGYVTRFAMTEAVTGGQGAKPLSELKRPIMAVPELASVADALEQMVGDSEHIAMVVDEYGGMEGIVTLEDLIESLLGDEITDETDPVTDMRELARRKRHRR